MSQIRLDGWGYWVDGKSYKSPANTFTSQFRGNTGLIARVESGIFDNVYDITVNVNMTEYERLKATYVKGTTQWLDFTDWAGRQWNPTGSGSGILNTGVKFMGALEESRQTEAGDNSFLVKFEGSDLERQRYLVKFRLQVNSTIP